VESQTWTRALRRGLTIVFNQKPPKAGNEGFKLIKGRPPP